MNDIAETATLANGYTMADADRIARIAMHYARSSSLLTWAERYDAAWFRIIELIYESPEPMRDTDLAFAGADAVSRAITKEQKLHGWDEVGKREMPRFTLYWTVKSENNDGFSEGIAERLSLPKVLSLLTPKEYEAIAALAVHGSNVAAAAALGIPSRAFGQRIARARARILPLWYAPETPRSSTTRKRPDEDHCTVGHDLAEHGRVDARGYVRCRRCERNQTRRQNARSA